MLNDNTDKNEKDRITTSSNKIQKFETCRFIGQAMCTARVRGTCPNEFVQAGNKKCDMKITTI